MHVKSYSWSSTEHSRDVLGALPPIVQMEADVMTKHKASISTVEDEAKI